MKVPSGTRAHTLYPAAPAAAYEREKESSNRLIRLMQLTFVLYSRAINYTFASSKSLESRFSPFIRTVFYSSPLVLRRDSISTYMYALNVSNYLRIRIEGKTGGIFHRTWLKQLKISVIPSGANPSKPSWRNRRRVSIRRRRRGSYICYKRGFRCNKISRNSTRALKF